MKIKKVLGENHYWVNDPSICGCVSLFLYHMYISVRMSLSDKSYKSICNKLVKFVKLLSSWGGIKNSSLEKDY